MRTPIAERQANDAAVALKDAVSRRHVKRPDTFFSSEQDPNRAGAAPFRAVAEAIVGPAMRALAAPRQA